MMLQFAKQIRIVKAIANGNIRAPEDEAKSGRQVTLFHAANICA